MLGLPVRYLAQHPLRALRVLGGDPRETWNRIYEDYAYTAERRRSPPAYQAQADWEAQLHAALGVPFPCGGPAESAPLWPAIAATLRARGIEIGPESYLYWNDGDPALIRAIWCLIRHLKPLRVVETGVAHGVSSRFILEALALNGAGQLWSIDLPPVEHDWAEQIGIAVDERNAERWRLIRGSSRVRLPSLLAELGAIDMFIHDSLHSARNVRFELDCAWAALGPGGRIVVDDIDANDVFGAFVAAHRPALALVCEAEPVRPDPRRFNGKGLFGIMLKAPAPPASRD
jgi:predicted O-methyltransferase YrrM